MDPCGILTMDSRSPALLFLAVALWSGVSPLQAIDSSAGAYRGAIVTATQAIEGDSAPAVERRWQARAGRNPIALLGLATLARLRYDYAAADRIYGLLLA